MAQGLQIQQPNIKKDERGGLLESLAPTLLSHLLSRSNEARKNENEADKLEANRVNLESFLMKPQMEDLNKQINAEERPVQTPWKPMDVTEFLPPVASEGETEQAPMRLEELLGLAKSKEQAGLDKAVTDDLNTGRQSAIEEPNLQESAAMPELKPQPYATNRPRPVVSNDMMPSGTDQTIMNQVLKTDLQDKGLIDKNVPYKILADDKGEYYRVYEDGTKVPVGLSKDYGLGVHVNAQNELQGYRKQPGKIMDVESTRDKYMARAGAGFTWAWDNKQQKAVMAPKATIAARPDVYSNPQDARKTGPLVAQLADLYRLTSEVENSAKELTSKMGQQAFSQTQTAAMIALLDKGMGKSDESTTHSAIASQINRQLTPEEMRYVNSLRSLYEGSFSSRNFLGIGAQSNAEQRRTMLDALPGRTDANLDQVLDKLRRFDGLIHTSSKGLPDIPFGPLQITAQQLNDDMVFRHEGKIPFQDSILNRFLADHPEIIERRAGFADGFEALYGQPYVPTGTPAPTAAPGSFPRLPNETIPQWQARKKAAGR